MCNAMNRRVSSSRLRELAQCERAHRPRCADPRNVSPRRTFEVVDFRAEVVDADLRARPAQLEHPSAHRLGHDLGASELSRATQSVTRALAPLDQHSLAPRERRTLTSNKDTFLPESR